MPKQVASFMLSPHSPPYSNACDIYRYCNFEMNLLIPLWTVQGNFLNRNFAGTAMLFCCGRSSTRLSPIWSQYVFFLCRFCVNLIAMHISQYSRIRLRAVACLLPTIDIKITAFIQDWSEPIWYCSQSCQIIRVRTSTKPWGIFGLLFDHNLEAWNIVF